MAVLISQAHPMGVPRNFRENIGTTHFTARGEAQDKYVYLVSIRSGSKFHTNYYNINYAAATHVSFINSNYILAAISSTSDIIGLIYAHPIPRCEEYL